MIKKIIHSENAPQAIGTYSQAVRINNTVYLSGQIGLDPKTMKLETGIEAQIHRVFSNLRSVSEAAGGSLANVVKINVFLTDLSNFSIVNAIMAEYFSEPYPARAAVGVASLPREAMVEADGILELEG